MKSRSQQIQLFVLTILIVFSQAIYAQKAVPHLWSQVTDEAGVLSAGTKSQLENSLKIFADTTTNQVAVLIIQSLEGEVLEEYSLKVAMENGLGQKDRDNGVLLLIAIGDREMRIEVGYGLEGVLTDAICSQIIRNEIAPNFRRQDYDQGVTDGVNAILHAIGGEYSAEDEMDIAEGLGMTWQEQLMIGIFIFSILGIFTFFAIMTKGGVGWFLYFFLIPFYAAFPGAIFGWGIGMKILIGYLVVVAILKIIANIMGWSKKPTGGSGGGGWSSGSGWSSGGSSFGGGGGFSGGGGSFGGGGSSGGW